MPLLGVPRTPPQGDTLTRLVPSHTRHRYLYLTSHARCAEAGRGQFCSQCASKVHQRGRPGPDELDDRDVVREKLSGAASGEPRHSSLAPAAVRTPPRSESSASIVAAGRRTFQRRQAEEKAATLPSPQVWARSEDPARLQRREQKWCRSQYSNHERRMGLATDSKGPDIIASSASGPGYWSRTGFGGCPDTESAPGEWMCHSFGLLCMRVDEPTPHPCLPCHPAINFALRQAEFGEDTKRFVAHIPETVRPEMVAVLQGVARKVHQHRLKHPPDWTSSQRALVASTPRSGSKSSAQVTVSRSRGDLGVTAGRRGCEARQTSRAEARRLRQQRHLRSVSHGNLARDPKPLEFGFPRNSGTVLPRPKKLRLGATHEPVQALAAAARTKRRQKAFEAKREAKRKSWEAKYAVSRKEMAQAKEDLRLVRLILGGV